MRFSDIPGLKKIKRQLTHSAERNHHAQIYAGKPGSGNLALAMAYANFINCENPAENDSCGECPSCQKIDKLIHPDFHFIFPVSPTQKFKQKDAVSKNFMPQWRELLVNHPYVSLEDWINHFGENKQVNISKEESRQIIQRLSLKSFEAQFKIMLIWLPEWMNSAAANAILKILEEPPEKTVFLLVTNDYERLLPTIQSRAQLINVPSFQDEDISQYLQKNFELKSADAERIARLSKGNLNLAIKHLDLENTAEDDNFINWMRHCWDNNFEQLVVMSEAFHSINKIAQKDTLTEGLDFLRSALLSGQEIQIGNAANGNSAEKFGATVNPLKIELISKELNSAYYHLERNASAKMTHLALSLTISRILKSK